MDRPEPEIEEKLPEKIPEPPSAEEIIPVEPSSILLEEKMPRPHSDEKGPPTCLPEKTIPISTKLQEFWKQKISSGCSTSLPAPPPPAPGNSVEGLRRSQRLRELQNNFTHVEKDIQKIPVDPILKPLEIPPPKTLKEARLSPWWPQYEEAAQKEYDGHLKNGTWTLVPISSIPPGKNILRGKWVFDDKRNEAGQILKFKARFVVMGFTQKPGIDYHETFAGVVVAKSFRIMLSILNEDPTYEMDHWDVRMAFTQAPVDEELYMHQPEGFEKAEKIRSVCKLEKSLYGLKQSARNWQLLLRVMLKKKIFYP